MEFLDKLVLHQSAHHMVLIKYLLVLTHILFIGYIGLLLGSLIYSLYFKNRFKKTKEKNYYSLSKDLIDLGTFNKGAAFTFGLIPLLSAMFGYSQLLHLTNVNISLFFFWSIIFLFFALLLIFSFKYSFHLKDIFSVAEKSNVDSNDVKVEIERYKSSAINLYEKSGRYGLILLLISVYLYSAATQISNDLSSWNSNRNFFTELFSLNTLTFFLQFINISFLIISIIFLFKYFRNNSEVKISNEGYKQFIKKFSLKSIALFSVILPIVIVLNSFSKPTVALSFSFFGVTVIVLLLLLLVSSLGYLMLKEDSVKYVNAVVFIFVLSYSLLVVREQYTFDTATKSHFAFLSNEYDTYEMKLKQEAGLVKVSISGEEIYNGKCIACHQFDRRVVGPAHNDVLPKYEGKKDALVKFILNPVKVNPEYPAMPNQGLKPNEAEAVADYMLTHYKKK